MSIIKLPIGFKTVISYDMKMLIIFCIIDK